MFRILIIVGLLLAGLQQSLARGNVELSETDAAIGVVLLQDGDLMESGALGEEPATADSTPSYCKSSDCKAVIGTAFLGSFKTAVTPDTLRPVRRSSVTGRLEPRPPNS